MTLDEVCAVLETGSLFEVRKHFSSPATIKIERLRYAGILGQPGAIKVEIDHFHNVVLAPRLVPYQNVWGLAVELPVMDVREVAAEKLRAACQRARSRDFYDLFLILESYALGTEELVSLLLQKEVRAPITIAGLLQNWARAQHEHADNAGQIYYARAVATADIDRMVQSLRFDPILPPT